ncbi:uncharacterized protein AMSG_05775 [Thecamonas trahens ATCC 50062]|uniref:Uncharacterized protein n=1 Tax=Thecamonas trahens ATCC 50062 TaxID=461836 RepID=A0A0L0DFC9_THETB|nr:hypothetical protein AMSG_05775 [Thecamonas trahens ATCC 50062]KNC50018.1 hypothetical protein AMSG_05775 [Thecamonas trahens ATCC 50062]|eukprot:XP_013757185.1 hypothetical protein AMSG_05775 [Thecamonas trahens ATCC 50062]
MPGSSGYSTSTYFAPLHGYDPLIHSPMPLFRYRTPPSAPPIRSLAPNMPSPSPQPPMQQAVPSYVARPPAAHSTTHSTSYCGGRRTLRALVMDDLEYLSSDTVPDGDAPPPPVFAPPRIDMLASTHTSAQAVQADALVWSARERQGRSRSRSASRSRARSASRSRARSASRSRARSPPRQPDTHRLPPRDAHIQQLLQHSHTSASLPLRLPCALALALASAFSLSLSLSLSRSPALALTLASATQGLATALDLARLAAEPTAQCCSDAGMQHRSYLATVSGVCDSP